MSDLFLSGRRDSLAACLLRGRGLGGLLLLAVVVALPFFCNAYWLDVCVSIGLYALLALSLNLILGQAGIFCSSKWCVPKNGMFLVTHKF